MTKYVYEGTLADLEGQSFPDAHPNLWVAPEADSTGPGGVMIPHRRKVRIDVESDGSWELELFASVDLSPSRPYRLRCEWVRDPDGALAGWAEWVFVAVAGGGRVADMGASTPVSVWRVGPPWPAPPLPPGWYFDTVTNDVGRIVGV